MGDLSMMKFTINPNGILIRVVFLGLCYEYSGRENVGQSWHPAVLEIKKKVPFLKGCWEMLRVEHGRTNHGFHGSVIGE
jgi:hypothetical protein